MAFLIDPPYDIFTDIDGKALESGYIWVGDVNLDPQTNPASVFWDEALTISASQPIRTISGYPSNNGTPARFYVANDYSIRVMNKNGATIYTSLSGNAAASKASNISVNDGAGGTIFTTLQGFINKILSSTGAAIVGFIQSLTGAVVRTVAAKLGDTVCIYDFMTPAQIAACKARTSTDDTVALKKAIDSGAYRVYLPAGLYKTTDEVLFKDKYGLQWIGEGQSNTEIRYTGDYVAGRAVIKLETSSYCLFEGIKATAWAGGANLISEIAKSKADFCFYVTSEGNHPLTQYNTFKGCRGEWARKAGYQIGNYVESDIDVNTDGNSIIDSFASWTYDAVVFYQANTNMSRIIGGAIGDVSHSGIVIGRNARGITIDNVLAYNTATAFIRVKKENSGCISIKNINQEIYQGPFLVVEPVSGGLSNKSLISIEDVNCTNNDPTVGNPTIMHEGAGTTIMKNCRFGGNAAGRGGVGAKLVFRPANGGIGGTQILTTEGVELYDGATWDVETRQNSSWVRWIDTLSTLRTGAAGEGALSTPIVRLSGRINFEVGNLVPITLPAGVTQNTLGYVGDQVFKVTIDKAAWTTAGASQSIVFATLPKRTTIVGCYADVTTAFAGLAGTIQLAVMTTVGVELLTYSDVKTAAVVLGTTAGQLGTGLTTSLVQGVFVPNWNSDGGVQIQAVLASGSGNIGNGTVTNLSAGVVSVYLITRTMPNY